MLGNFLLTNYESLELYTANVFLFYWQNHGHIILIRTMMIPELNTLQQRHLNFSNFPNKLVGGYLGIFGGGVLPGFPTPSLRSRRCTRKNVCASRRHARGDLTPRVSPSRGPVLSFAHYFQAPATQAILLQTLFQTKTRIFHRPVFTETWP